MQQDKPFRGVFVIVVTPFDEQGNIDEESLRAEVEFCLEAGVHGLVIPANASEWFTLSDAERRRASEIVVEQTRRRAPVVLSVTGGSQWAAVEMAQAAQDIGADGLMAMPPPLKPPLRDGLFEYYRGISQIARVPIIIQNCHPPLGTPMPPDLLARMVDELPQVDYVKEEADPCTHLMSQVSELIKDRAKFKGIFGGQAGRFFMNEAARGACGTMPAWETRHIYYRILPLLTMESLYPMVIYKEVLRRRGAIRTATVRNPSHAPLDEVDHRELDILLDELSDLLTVKGPFA
jgi:4-hydroxy-tetrahydrodipicolinate synthase